MHDTLFCRSAQFESDSIFEDKWDMYNTIDVHVMNIGI